MSAELLNFHEVVNHMQEAEEEVIDNHRQLLEDAQHWHELDIKLLNMTDDVDYDVECESCQLLTPL